MPNVRLISLLAILCFILSSCSGVGEGTRYPATTGVDCFEVGKNLIDEFQTELSLAKGIKRTVPGQLTYGRPRVDYLRYRFNKWSFEKIQEYLDARPIPYVETPDGKWVIHDRHHMFLALFKEKANLEERFPNQALKLTYQRKATFKESSWADYRHFMKENNTILLRAKGRPISWRQIPRDFNSMDKDFFRGMAWVLIKAGIVEKQDKAFFEFIWADELRKRFPKLPTRWRLEHVEEVFEDIITNPADYRHLPGLVDDGPNVEEALENIEKISDALSW
jgi:hypothetical protein